MSRKTLFCVPLLLCWISPTAVQAADPKCAGAEYSRFTFLEGAWDSIWLAKNQLVGRYTIERASGGCALLIQWKGAPATPGDGLGLISYSPAKRLWQRFWKDDTGAWELASANAGDASPIVWEGERSDPNDRGKLIRLRITWEATASGLLENYEMSRDGGKTWRSWGRFRLQRPT